MDMCPTLHMFHYTCVSSWDVILFTHIVGHYMCLTWTCVPLTCVTEQPLLGCETACWRPYGPSLDVILFTTFGDLLHMLQINPFSVVRMLLERHVSHMESRY